jgi:hypothetical protein
LRLARANPPRERRPCCWQPQPSLEAQAGDGGAPPARTRLAVDDGPGLGAAAAGRALAHGASEKDAKLAQKLDQLHPFIAVFTHCVTHRHAWANLHLSGKPETFFRSSTSAARAPPASSRRRRPRRWRCTPRSGSCAAPSREKEIGGSGGSLEPSGPLHTHLHTAHMACSECLPTRLNPPG